jgi:hypothetical protein
LGDKNSDDGQRPAASLDLQSAREDKADEPLSEQQLNRAAQFLTTEHFTLQTARASTIADSSSRASLFMSTLSSAIIALALVGQISQAGTIFNAFALLLFPPLFFLGLVTFVRVLQLAVADWAYLRGINRIRHFYLENAPQAHKYFFLSAGDDTLSASDDTASAVRQPVISRRQWFLTTAGTIMVINSLLLGVFTGLALRAFFDLPPVWLITGGLATFAVCLALHFIYQDRQWSAAAKRMPPVFPRDPSQSQVADLAGRAGR